MSTKVVTGKVRFSYAHIFEAHAHEEGQTPKYSVSLIIPKKDKKTLAAIEAAIKEAYEEGKGKYGGKLPTKWKNPLRDGDEDREDDEAYEGSMFVNANSTRKVKVIDVDKDEILDKDDFYSGCYGRASVNFFAYNFNGTKGVGCGINILQKLDDGESLGAPAASADDFDDDELM